MLVTLDTSGLDKVSTKVYARHIPNRCMTGEPCVILCNYLTEDNIVTILMHEELHHALFRMWQKEIELQITEFNAMNSDLDRVLGGWKNTRGLLDPDFWPPVPKKKKLKMKRNVKT